MKGLFLVFLIAGLVFCQDDDIVSILLEPVNTDGLMVSTTSGPSRNFLQPEKWVRPRTRFCDPGRAVENHNLVTPLAHDKNKNIFFLAPLNF